jgi:membrane protein YqaA with SNARE-associated domain
VYALLRYFLSAPGLFALATLDSSLVFFLPLAIDAAIIVLAARRPDFAWLYPLVATLGSLLGTTVTFWIGAKIGEAGLTWFIPARRLERVKQRVATTGAVALASLALIPPPFPFTPFVLTCGALEVKRVPFFSTLAAARLLRFVVDTYLARLYGQQILSWMRSPAFKLVVWFFIVIAVAGTSYSLYRVLKSSRRDGPRS